MIYIILTHMVMALAMARYYLKKPPYLGGFIIAGIA